MWMYCRKKQIFTNNTMTSFIYKICMFANFMFVLWNSCLFRFLHDNYKCILRLWHHCKQNKKLKLEKSTYFFIAIMIRKIQKVLIYQLMLLINTFPDNLCKQTPIKTVFTHLIHSDLVFHGEVVYSCHLYVDMQLPTL